MKKNIVLSILLLFSVTIYASDWEMDRGSKEIGGTFSFESKGGDLYVYGQGDRYTVITIAPTYQYFIYPRFSIGGKLNLRGSGPGTSLSIAAGPAMTYYLGNSNSKNLPFAGVCFLAQSESISDSKLTTIQLTGGIAFIIVEHYALKANIFLNFDKRKDSARNGGTRSGKVFGLAVGFSGFIH